jgi:hypothetical protein
MKDVSYNLGKSIKLLSEAECPCVAPSAFASQLLGLQVCATMPRKMFFKCKYLADLTNHGCLKIQRKCSLSSSAFRCHWINSDTAIRINLFLVSPDYF